MTNSIRPVVVASQLDNGEAQDAKVPRGMWMVERPSHAVGSGEKPNQRRERQQGVGDRMIGRFNTANKETWADQDGVPATKAARASGDERPPLRRQCVHRRVATG